MPAFRFAINTVVKGEKTSFDDFNTAARHWDMTTLGTPPLPGDGIEVQEFRKDQDGEVMVRDGWLMHVEQSGSVYINPNWV
jgi:hypothetical protein